METFNFDCPPLCSKCRKLHKPQQTCEAYAAENAAKWAKAKPCPNCDNKTLRSFCTPQCRMEWQDARYEEMAEIIKAVAHIGVDFGFGEYELEQKHIDAARKLHESEIN